MTRIAARAAATAPRSCVRVLLAGLVLIASGCFGGDSGPDGPPLPLPPPDAPVIDVDQLRTAHGDVTYCTDPSIARREAVARFNEINRGRLSVTIFKIPTDSRKQREFFLKHTRCDVYDSDVVWMAEWAARGRVYNMRPYIQYAQRPTRPKFIPNTLATAEYADRYWGVPHTTNAGFLFYRTDKQVSREDRSTWQRVYGTPGGTVVYQAKTPEPMTVNFLEIAFAAGGRVLSPDGRRSVIDSPENLDALRLMVAGITSGEAPRGVLTDDEPRSTDAFAEGATFMRNWPDKFDVLAKSAIAGRYDVAPLPIFAGAGVAGVLGGADLVIDSDAVNPGGGLALIDFLISPEQQKLGLVRHSEPSVLAGTYRDPEVTHAVSFAGKLFRAIRQGRPRPVSASYVAITDAISKNVHDALSDPNAVSPEEALRRAQDEIDRALAKGAEL